MGESRRREIAKLQDMPDQVELTPTTRQLRRISLLMATSTGAGQVAQAAGQVAQAAQRQVLEYLGVLAEEGGWAMPNAVNLAIDLDNGIVTINRQTPSMASLEAATADPPGDQEDGTRPAAGPVRLRQRRALPESPGEHHEATS